MPSINLKKELYDKLVKKGENVPDYTNKAVEEKIKRADFKEEVEK